MSPSQDRKTIQIVRTDNGKYYVEIKTFDVPTGRVTLTDMVVLDSVVEVGMLVASTYIEEGWCEDQANEYFREAKAA